MVLAPRTRVMHHDGLGDVRRRVAVVLVGVVAPRRKTEDRVVGEEVAVEGFRVGVGKQLVPVPAQPSVRVERPVDPEPVTLTRTHTRHVAVPDVVGHLSSRTRCSVPPLPSAGSSNRQTSTLSACGANSAKLVPSPSQVAPSGVGRPGQLAVSSVMTRPVSPTTSYLRLGSAACLVLPARRARLLSTSRSTGGSERSGSTGRR